MLLGPNNPPPLVVVVAPNALGRLAPKGEGFEDGAPKPAIILMVSDNPLLEAHYKE